MESTRRNTRCDAHTCGATVAEISESLVVRAWRIHEPGKEGTMRQLTRMHRTLTVLAVGLLALAAPLVASADGGGPGTG